METSALPQLVTYQHVIAYMLLHQTYARSQQDPLTKSYTYWHSPIRMSCARLKRATSQISPPAYSPRPHQRGKDMAMTSQPLTCLKSRWTFVHTEHPGGSDT